MQQNEGIERRVFPVDDPLRTVTAAGNHHAVLFSGWYKQNSTEPHAEWRAALADLALEDCYFRMLSPHEVGRGCGFDTDFPGHRGEFVVWGSARDQVDGFGNAVSPTVGAWIGARLRAVLDMPGSVA